MLRWIAARHTAMDPEDVKAILDVALRTLRKVPMTIDGTDAFFEYLREFGCEMFMRRGLKAAGSEWKLICAKHNLPKLFRSGRPIWN